MVIQSDTDKLFFESKNRDFDNAISDFDYKDSMSFFDATRKLAVIIREEGRK